jgi:hypothetical protein
MQRLMAELGGAAGGGGGGGGGGADRPFLGILDADMQDDGEDDDNLPPPAGGGGAAAGSEAAGSMHGAAGGGAVPGRAGEPPGRGLPAPAGSSGRFASGGGLPFELLPPRQPAPRRRRPAAAQDLGAAVGGAAPQPGDDNLRRLLPEDGPGGAAHFGLPGGEGGVPAERRATGAPRAPRDPPPAMPAGLEQPRSERQRPAPGQGQGQQGQLERPQQQRQVYSRATSAFHDDHLTGSDGAPGAQPRVERAAPPGPSAPQQQQQQHSIDLTRTAAGEAEDDAGQAPDLGAQAAVDSPAPASAAPAAGAGGAAPTQAAAEAGPAEAAAAGATPAPGNSACTALAARQAAMEADAVRWGELAARASGAVQRVNDLYRHHPDCEPADYRGPLAGPEADVEAYEREVCCG